jgi:microcompartment protein CcmK/EutM
MYLGRVVGSVWATVKNSSMTGCRMLVVQPVTPELRNTGKRLICTDSTGAGAGELVYWVRGKEASFPFHPDEPPVDTTIVGIVDEVHVKRTPRAEAAVAVPVQAQVQAKAPAPVHRKASRKAERC